MTFFQSVRDLSPRTLFHAHGDDSMGKHTFAVVVLTLFAAVVPAGDDAVKAELKKLEGTGQLVSGLKEGKEPPAEIVKKVRVVVKGATHTVYFGDDVAVKEIP